MSERVVTMGVFDGMHRGHQVLLATVRQRADDAGAVACAVTFDPHPATILAPANAPSLIATMEQRLEWFHALGVDDVVVLPFTPELARESAATFVRERLVERLAMRTLVVGDDVHLGHNREGDLGFLREQGDQFGFDVVHVDTVGAAERCSSTAVRTLVSAGDVVGAAALLTRPFVVRAPVVGGDGRGRTLGFATANLAPSSQQLVPGLGIYAAAVYLDGAWRPAAVSVGTRPQFYDDGAALVEVHVVDYDGNLYDHVLDVAFLAFLRPEARFESVDDLVAQMAADVRQTREIFKMFSPTSPLLLG